MLRMCTVSAALALLVVLPDAARAAGPDEEAIRKFGLLGTWAVDCSKPVSGQNPYQTYAVKNGSVTRTLRMANERLDGTFDMRRLSLIGGNILAYNDRKQVGSPPSYDIHLEMSSGRFRSISSIQNDGKVMVKDSTFVASGAPTPVFEKCSAR
jgi:hypothetical protein